MSGLTPGQLVKLVKMLQQHSYPLEGLKRRWREFLQAISPPKNTLDPAKLDPQILREYVVSLIEPSTAQPADTPAQSQQQQQPAANGTDPSTSQASGDHYAKNQKTVARYVNWLQRVDKESRKRYSSAPPISRPRRIAAATPTSPTASTPPTAATEALQQQEQPQRQPLEQPQLPQQPPVEHPLCPRPVDAWDLVHATRGHPHYARGYDFPSYLKGWARTKRRLVKAPEKLKRVKKSVLAALRAPRLLALDCEMVSTEDGDTSCLVNLSLVDEQGKVVYTSKVQPRHKVKEWRTDITGLKEGDLEGVTTTRTEARRAVKALLLESWRAHGVPTILVGHGLRNDLIALRLDHQPCIDTSYIFSYKSLPGCTPSLRDLHLRVLGSDMKARGAGRHDSAEDAYAAMRLVQHELGREARTPPLPAPEQKAQRTELCSLLVHSIPPSVDEARLLALFTPMLSGGSQVGSSQTLTNGTPLDNAMDQEGNSDQEEEEEGDSDGSGDDSDEEGHGLEVLVANKASKPPCLSEAPVFGGCPGIREGRATLVFKHPGEASAAFNALIGPTDKDNMGLPTKRVKLGEGIAVKVRKCAAHNGFKFSQQRVKPAGAKPGQRQGGARVGRAVEAGQGGLQQHGLREKHVKPQRDGQAGQGVMEGTAMSKGSSHGNGAAGQLVGQKRKLPPA